MAVLRVSQAARQYVERGAIVLALLLVVLRTPSSNPLSNECLG